jgi:hypothetical protein
MSPEDFITKWQSSTLTERAGAQAHFLDLCELLGVDKPHDPEHYCFERGARKETGLGTTRGWADVWKRNHFAWEYKAPGGNLDAALGQLLAYSHSLDNPPLLVACDRLNFVIHTQFTNRRTEKIRITLPELAQAEQRAVLRQLFTDPQAFRRQETRAQVTEQAAKLIGDMAQAMQARGYEARRVAHFLNKVVFCFFAQNTKRPHGEPLLPWTEKHGESKSLLGRLIDIGQKDPARFSERLGELFRQMNRQHGIYGAEDIEWFNGGLFADNDVIPLTKDDVERLNGVSVLDWSSIDPAIFGTLFERGLNPAKRSQLGAHYTDPASIMRIVGPTVIAPLKAEWAEKLAQLTAQMEIFAQLQNSAKPKERSRASAAMQAANTLYVRFLVRLGNFRVLDPACGSGNFLYLALQALKDLEHECNLQAEAAGLQRNLIPHVGPQCVLGIELEPYAAELARVTVWIGEIQWMVRHGYEPAHNPILRNLDKFSAATRC